MSEGFTVLEKETFMREALHEAQKALAIGEVPIGAVIVHGGEIIARAHNVREHTQDATTHAEVLAIQEACRKVGSWRLEECYLFVTLEPCPMCSGALILSRMAGVYFGAMDPKAGTAGSLLNLLEDPRFNHQVPVEAGILGQECGTILTNFFRDIRARKKKAKKASLEE